MASAANAGLYLAAGGAFDALTAAGEISLLQVVGFTLASLPVAVLALRVVPRAFRILALVVGVGTAVVPYLEFGTPAAPWLAAMHVLTGLVAADLAPRIALRRGGRAGGRRAGLHDGVVVVALAATVLGACGTPEPAVRVAAVDGGDERVVGLATVQVAARAGEVVQIRNANTGELPEDDETAPGAASGEHAADPSVTHLFVAAPPDALPPVFVPQAAGFGPNAGVWGQCRGGDAADAVGTCPIPPVEGPTTWDGTSYWSTGALLPGESADVPLDAAIDEGRYTLVCALHPELRVEVDVDAQAPGDGAASAASPAPPEVPPLSAFEDAAPQEPATVVAGARAEGDAPGTLQRFVPPTISIGVGEEVTWVVEGRDPHDVNLGLERDLELVDSQPEQALPSAPEGGWDGRSEVRSGYLSTDPDGPAGDRFTVRFTEPGTYPYVCRFHPSMTGVVEVTGP